MRAFIFMFLFFYSILVRAEVIVRAQTDNYIGNFFLVNASSSPTSGYKIQVNLSCFGTNLRSVANPISPMATVRMGIGIGPDASAMDADPKKQPGDFALLFPGWMVMKRDGDSNNYRPINVDLNFKDDGLNGGKAFGVQNTVTIIPPASARPQIAFKSDGTIDADRMKVLTAVRYIHFGQYVPGDGSCWGARADLREPGSWLNLFAGLFGGFYSRAGGGFVGDVGNPGSPADKSWGEPNCSPIQDPSMQWPAPPTAAQRAYYQMYQGVTGKLSGTWSSFWSADFKLLTINASFPGQNGFCGGYFSPLMLFFDGKRPKFSSRSHFQLDPRAAVIHWPEADHAGYFLVYDRNGDGIINDGEELFGSNERFAHGFEALAAYDSNHDGVIDRKDEIFSKLHLWKDSTGEGRTLRRDLYRLSDLGVTSIDLRYHSGDTILVERNAELREHSVFRFRRDGQERRGQVIDVWLTSP